MLPSVNTLIGKSWQPAGRPLFKECPASKLHRESANYRKKKQNLHLKRISPERPANCRLIPMCCPQQALKAASAFPAPAEAANFWELEKVA
jgi:hypothetical protein